MTRREQREAVLSLLYEYTFNEGMSVTDFLSDKEAYNEEEYDKYIKESFVGTITAISEIDASIAKYAVRWKISRISRIAKSILRFGVYELTFTETPPKVVINEAVELAKKYAEDKAASFVNGILNNFARGEGKITDPAPNAEQK